jgi:hypothetical protein
MAVGMCAYASDTPWVIVKGGKPRAVIVISKDAGTPVRIAADDLQSYVEKMSGARLPIREGDASSAKGTTAILMARVNEGRLVSDESLLIRTERKPGLPPAIVLGGRGDSGVMYATYTFIEKLGVRFFHPEQEYVPKRSDLQVGDLNIVQSPAFKWRGIQQHTLHPIEYTNVLMAQPSEENLRHAYRYVEWLAKNRQNYLFWWWVDLYDVSSRREYVGKIVRHAHDRGVKVGLVVGMPFHQQHSYNLLKRDACHSDTAAWTQGLHEGIDEIASLGIDAMCIFFGETEGKSFKQPAGCPDVVSPVKGTVERIEAVRTYVKAKYPNIFVTLWVHPTANTPGDESCPRYFFLPKLCSPDIGAAVHTTMFYDLVNPAPTYANKDFAALREFALEQTKVRPVWYWPETTYWCGFDIDMPVYFPLYIKSRWVDADLLANKIDGHITFSSGLEWMYWLNDYSVARFGWNPKVYTQDAVLDDFASIFGPRVGGVVKASLNDLISANDLYLIKRSNKDGYNLMEILAANTSRRGIGKIEGMPSAEIKEFRATYLPDLRALAESYDRAYTRLKALQSKVGLQEKPWFDELLDTLEIANLRCMHQLRAYDAVSKLALDEASGSDVAVVDDKAVSDMLALQAQGKEIVARRQSGYRFPHGAGSPYYGYLPTVAEWTQTTDYLKTLTSSASAFVKEGIARPIRCTHGRLEVVGDVGLTRAVSVTVPDDYPVDKGLRLMMTLSDTDSATEGVMILAGKEYPLPMSGDSETTPAKFDLAPGTLHHGANEIVFRFNDNVGGSTRGYYVYSVVLGIVK